MHNIEIKTAEYDSELYRQTVALRDEVLRRPLGLEISVQDVGGEASQFHIAAVSGSRVVGCVVLKPIEEQTVQLRQMAVAVELQRTGIGSALVRFAESVASGKGFREIVLNARESAIGFYSRLGYEGVPGSEHIEVGIPHLRMKKNLGHSPSNQGETCG